jgi:hypothetical protein
MCGVCGDDAGQIQERRRMQPSEDAVLGEALVLAMEQVQNEGQVLGEVREQAGETWRALGPVCQVLASAATCSTAGENLTPKKQLHHPSGSAKEAAIKPPSTWLQQ